MTRQVVRALAGVLRSLATAIDSFVPVERNLRVLADALDSNDDPEGTPTTTRRGPASPRPTVTFSDLDSKKADRALARFGMRRST